DEIIGKYVEMNIAHPFREGNGRSMRLWLDHLLKNEIEQVIGWSKISKEDYLLAMERSPIKDVEIKILLKNALTDKINDREVYMKGIDESYHYEWYNLYETEHLQDESERFKLKFIQINVNELYGIRTETNILDSPAIIKEWGLP